MRRLRVVLFLLGSVLFMASSPGGCETVSDPRPIVVDDHTPERSTSPFTSQWGYSAAQLAKGATSLSWSPDGEHILFSSGGILGIYVVDSAGLELRAFPETAPQFGDWERPGAFAPSLSPDGSRVAYSVFVPRDSSVIETGAFDGSDVRRLTPFESNSEPYNQHSIYPVWSPDGQQIAFVSNRAVSDEYYGDQLFVMGADGSDVRAVAPSIRVECHETWQGARWSPDGSWLAFAGSEPRGEGGERIGLYTVRFDGFGINRISDLYRSYCGPAVWSPDSSKLAFMGEEVFANGDYQPYFYLAESDGSAVTPLGATSWAGVVVPPAPAWSPNGAWLAFQGMQKTGTDSRGPAIYVVRPDDSEVRNVSLGQRGAWYGPVMWTPDSEGILDGELGHEARLDGSGLREWLPYGDSGLLQVAWSPDRFLLAVLSVYPGDTSRFVLYTLERDGTDRRVLVRGTANRLVAEHSDWRDVSRDIKACAEIYSGNPGLVRDCQTLLRIRDTLAGEAFLNWSATIPIGEWQGIYVWGTPQRVRQLSFGWSESNTLRGAIPPELGSLTELEVLFISEQHLAGEIPSQIGNLRKLKFLHLYRSNLGGQIPAELGNLTELTELMLHDNGLSGRIPASLGNLIKLEELYLDFNSLTGSIPPEIGNLKRLERLGISSNDLTGTIPPELGELTNLRVLHLQHNQLGGTLPPELGNLENLVNLYLQGNNLRGCVPSALSDRLVDMGTEEVDYCD